MTFNAVLSNLVVLGGLMTFKLTVTYAAGHDQEHTGLSAETVEQGTGAFLRDLINLKGEGITAFKVEIEK